MTPQILNKLKEFNFLPNPGSPRDFERQEIERQLSQLNPQDYIHKKWKKYIPCGFAPPLLLLVIYPQATAGLLLEAAALSFTAFGVGVILPVWRYVAKKAKYKELQQTLNAQIKHDTLTYFSHKEHLIELYEAFKADPALSHKQNIEALFAPCLKALEQMPIGVRTPLNNTQGAQNKNKISKISKKSKEQLEFEKKLWAILEQLKNYEGQAKIVNAEEVQALFQNKTTLEHSKKMNGIELVHKAATMDGGENVKTTRNPASGAQFFHYHK